MANTYTQIYIHIVFAVQGRQNLMGCRQIFLAGRFRCVFLLPFTAQHGDQVHSKPTGASSMQEL
jgi:hypothetical protein